MEHNLESASNKTEFTDETIYVYKYLGSGFIPGVPARDLTEGEYKYFEHIIKEYAQEMYKKTEVN